MALVSYYFPKTWEWIKKTNGIVKSMDEILANDLEASTTLRA
jgi:hypothetical protein